MDVSYGDDLPLSIKEALRPPKRVCQRRSDYQPVLIHLLGEHGVLTPPELRAGIYRAIGRELTSNALQSHIRALYTKGLVKYEARGKYALTSEGKQAYASQKYVPCGTEGGLEQ